MALFHRNKKRTPQFFGKWPFIRIFGMQEPAAAIFSMMNLFAHVHLLRRFHKKIPSDAPMRNVWIIYGFVSINAWVSRGPRDYLDTQAFDIFGKTVPLRNFKKWY